MRLYELQTSIITTSHWGLSDESHPHPPMGFGLQRTSINRVIALGSCFGSSKSRIPSNDYFKRNKAGDNLWKTKGWVMTFCRGNTNMKFATGDYLLKLRARER